VRRKSRRIAWVLLLLAFIGAAVAAPSPTTDTAQLLARADAIKMLDNASFQQLLEQLDQREATLSDADRWHLRYLEAWQAGYLGQYDKACALLEAVIKQAPDDDLRENARAALMHTLGANHRYQEAFAYLDDALDDLPHVTRTSTQQHVLGEATQLLTEAGQYDLAINYADQLLQIPDPHHFRCIGTSIKLQAEFRKGPHNDALLSQLQRGVDICLANGNVLSADTLRRDIASLEIERGNTDEAIALLQSNYEGMSKLQYSKLASEYNILLAEAYWKQNNAALAEKYAVQTVDIASKGHFAEPLSRAYQLLYQISRQQGDLRDALMYHEKFLSTDNIRLDDVHEKALAYQVAKQQVETKKAELDALNKQNQILQLQQTLDHKAVQASRLYIFLLLAVLASVAFLLYRMKRSQLRFMRLARCDSLTGILNRQHFVEEAEQALRQAARSMHGASLILADLDHFKMINDTHGHSVGDQVLQRAVRVFQHHLRPGDVFGRLGGEEFGILLKECSAEHAIERAEQIRRAVSAPTDDVMAFITITASLGVASTAHHGHDLHSLLMAADEALYKAKRHGRNRVVINVSGPGTKPAQGNEYRTDTNLSGASTDEPGQRHKPD
jgi:diguanylate cyclase (GGDEF)-like protein